MHIKEIITEEVVDEYTVYSGFNPAQTVRQGDTQKEYTTLVKTPMSHLFDVRYSDSIVPFHTYYFYDKETGKCVGVFEIEMEDYAFKKVLKPGVKAVIPHMSLLPQVQRQGIASQIYTTFLRGGPWVFITSSHSQAAARLWDSLVTGDIINVYVDDQAERIENSKSEVEHRMIGPKDRFL
jgi:hypothetical protein